MDKLMIHLFLLKGAVCAGADELSDVVMVVGAVGAVGAMGTVVVTVVLLDKLFSCTFT